MKSKGRRNYLARPRNRPDQARDRLVYLAVLAVEGLKYGKQICHARDESVGHVKQQGVQRAEAKPVDYNRNKGRTWAVGSHPEKGNTEEKPVLYVK